MYPNPLFAIIPDSFEEYFKLVDKDARTCYRKAQKAGCQVRKVDEITSDIYQDILDIYTSKTERQGRPMNHIYHMINNSNHDIREGWPHKNYADFKCKKHYLDFYGCFIGDQMVAFLELLHSNEVSTTYSTMGHADWLSKGVMKFLFLEVIRLANLKYLHYGDEDGKESMKYFLSDLRITNHDPQLIYHLANPDE